MAQEGAQALRRGLRMASRGKWLEAACESSLLVLQGRGQACIQKIATPTGRTRGGDIFRTRSTVDYIGAYHGYAFAFDAKATRQSSFPMKNVHQHQLDFLRHFTDAGGIGCLLIAFEDRGTGSFLVSESWYCNVRDELDHRSSIPYSRFVTGAISGAERCYGITHGLSGMAIPLHMGFDHMIKTR